MLRIEGAAPADAEALVATFDHLQVLYRAGRNRIWTFVFRNLRRPVWLSLPEQRADVLVRHGQTLSIRRRRLSGRISVQTRST